MVEIKKIEIVENIGVGDDLSIWIKLTDERYVPIVPETAEELIKKYFEIKNKISS